MTLKNALDITRIYQMKSYIDELDSDGKLRQITEFTWDMEPWESANEVRRDVIAKLVSGMQVDPQSLSPWAQLNYQLWQEDARSIMLMGVSPDPRYAPENSLVGKRVRKTTPLFVYPGNYFGDQVSVGTIVMECGNGVVVEWEHYGAEDGYSDRYKSVILIKPHTERKEFVVDDPSVCKLELESDSE